MRERGDRSMKPRDCVMQLWLMRKPPWKEFGTVSRIRGIKYDQSISELNQFINLKSKKLQRRLDISKLKGITVSVAKSSLEFVIHGNESEHDYLFSSKNNSYSELNLF